ncbi:MAG TPA: OsmC family peroxiredoxin [Hellea balneolensis]|uniref:OsmC family peroxiredoxin n=1 Tax=Hellea balneolensis TaxID=287478 RepID=A0A7C5R0M0_9PROT|nr:OsmC family peroxiredoxin [Hellea balneolensis]
MSNTVISKERPGGLFTQDVLVRDHRLYADEPVKLGGSDIGPSPYELVLAGLAACTSITLRMYAERKEWPVTHIEVETAYKKSGFGADMKNIFIRKIHIVGELDEAQRARLVEIADKCPVHNMLATCAEFRTEVI